MAALEVKEAAVAEGAEAPEVAEEAEVEEAAEAAAEAVVDLVTALSRGVAPVVVSRQQQQSNRETLSPQQLREWYAARQRGGGTGPCTYVLRTDNRAGEQCGGPHSTQRCFGRLTEAWRHQFPGASKIPHWGELSRAGVAILDLDFDAILAAMYAVDHSVAGDCYLCVPPDPNIEAAALGASAYAALGASASAAPGAGESALSGTTSAQALHTFTLDSGASRSFFRDRNILTPLSRPVEVSLADPSGGPVLASFSTVLPCPAASSGTLRQLATFTRRPRSSLYTLTTESPPATDSAQVAASSQAFAAASRSGFESAPCSCRLLSHQTLLWHHRLGHPSLPRLRGMASRVLVSGLPRSLPPLPAGPGPTCIPCIEGRQRAAPRSSEFPPTEAPLQTLHIDVWGPARVSGQGRERYFLLVVDDYSRYTIVFPSHSKGDVTEGIRQTFTLPASPQKNGIAERRIGMVMDVARMSMIRAAAPHFLWPFAVQYAVHQLNLQPRVSLPETSPALQLTGKIGDASAFQIWGSRAFVRDLSTDKLSPRAVPYVFLGFPTDSPGWQFYHPTSRRVLSSQDVTFDESVPYYRVSQVDQVEAVDAAVDSAAARRTEPAGAGSEGAETGGAETGGADLGALGLLEWPPAVLRRGGSCSLRQSYASGLPAARDVLLELEVLLELLGVLALVRLGVLLRLLELTVLLELVLLELELLELELLGVLALAVLLALVLVRVLELALLELEVLLALVLPLAVLVLSLLVLEALRSRDRGLAERREPASRPALPVHAAHTSGRTARPRPGAVPGTHQMVLRPSTAPLRVPLPSPPESSRPSLADSESDSLHAASPSVTRLLATVVTDPSFESIAVTDVLEDRQEEFQCFAAALPHLVSTLIAPEGDPDAPDIPTPRSYAEAIEGPYSSKWQLAMDAEMASWKSTGTYVDAAPPPGANIRDYELHSLDFTTTFLQGSLHEEIWLRRLPGFTGSFPPGTQWSLRRPVYGLRQAPREWHDTLRTLLAALGFAPSTSDPSLFLRTNTSLPPFYILGSGCEAEIYAGAMAAQELRWLTYLLTDLGEPPRSPPFLHVDNKAMLALCREHRLEHRTKHIALRYFLARELQQRG
ncbi:unnamed protein product [Closterium sp. NIES-65]|nr:unnamed protein product [Closterium sp. NIES-65]